MLQLTRIKKSFIQNNKSSLVLDDISFKVNNGEIVSVVGPNGCGKTTILNLIAGILKPDKGQIIFDGGISSMKIGYVFQDYRNSLFPWLTVGDNLSFPLKVAGISERQRLLRIKSANERFGFKVSLKRYPYQLSGGQQQFLSLVRSVITNPSILLLDEPFSSLDHFSTLFLLQKLSDVWAKTKVSSIFISHDIEEAIFLSQRIILLGNKPTRVLKVFDNPIPFPRTVNLLTSKKFSDIKRKILALYARSHSGYSKLN